MHKRAAILVAVLALWPLSGCVLPVAGVVVTFSPDGKRVVYRWSDFIYAGAPVVPIGVVPHSQYLFWCDAAGPSRQRSVRTDAVIGQAIGFPIPLGIYPGQPLALSADSRYATAGSLAKLIVADLRDGGQVQVNRADELVTSFAWLGPDTVGYSTQPRKVPTTQPATAPDDGPIATETIFWRQQVSGGPTRSEIFRTSIRPVTSEGQGWVCWSPKGRWVLYRAGGKLGRMMLRSIDTGRTQEAGASGLGELLFAWKPDGSAVLVLEGPWGAGGQSHAALVQTDPFKVTDLSEGFRRVFSVAFSRDDLVWTADGKHLVTNASLIDLATFERTEPGRALFEHVDESSYQSADLLPMPQAGWLYGQGPDLRWYAIDYSGTCVVEIGRASLGGAPSPDGRRFATVNAWKSVQVREVELPELPPAQPAQGTDDD